MTTLRFEAPASNEALRRAIYDGDVFLLDPTPASARLVARARAIVEEVFAEFDDVRTAQHALDGPAMFRRVGEARARIYADEACREAIVALIGEVGFDVGQIAHDAPRLRAVSHRGHENPAAAPVYYPHRDTWYAHPQALITWWLPLDDLVEEETFAFYPDWFRRAVPNDSEIFDYDVWLQDAKLKVGWQDPNAGKSAPYPGLAKGFEPGRDLGFACRRAQSLLFAGAHLHGTRPQETGRTRFSLDFRIVHLGDHAAGLGAPNVDNRSRGSALIDYVHPR